MSYRKVSKINFHVQSIFWKLKQIKMFSVSKKEARTPLSPPLPAGLTSIVYQQKEVGTLNSYYRGDWWSQMYMMTIFHLTNSQNIKSHCLYFKKNTFLNFFFTFSWPQFSSSPPSSYLLSPSSFFAHLSCFSGLLMMLNKKSKSIWLANLIGSYCTALFWLVYIRFCIKLIFS